MAQSSLPLMLGASTLVVLDKIAQGKPTARPLMGALVATVILSFVAQGAPDLAHSLAVLVFVTALLTSGGSLAARVQSNHVL